jgi:tRNA threonylcarbamoyladenosine biosynthesis protein TsaB
LLRAQHILNISATHNQRLLPGIDRILTDADWTLDDLDGLAVSLGPGSFTGLRIGLSVVKGLAWATGKPLAGVPTLDALAANVPLSPYPIYPVLDARKGEIYTALYRMDDEQVPARLTPYMAIKPEKLVDLISEKTLLVGDALLRYGDYLTGKLGERLHLVPPHLNVVQAKAQQRNTRRHLKLHSAICPSIRGRTQQDIRVRIRNRHMYIDKIVQIAYRY